ncbi:MAG: 2-oxoacid:acceptor oxidoreductase family protein, partial [Actinomycetota bacterium]
MTPETALQPESLAQVVIRFAGDSGDGMQLTGDRFTDVSAAFGNDLATLPNYPAEIRAPAGTIAGVSSFQVQISDHEILTPGDVPSVLVAMNPAALRANIDELAPGGTILVNSDAFEERNLDKAGYQANPLEDGSLAAYRVIQVAMTSMTLEATKDLGVKPRDAERSKNFFALGLLSWLYHRDLDATENFLNEKFSRKPEILKANIAALHAGYNYGDTTEDFVVRYEVSPAPMPAG